MVSLKFNFLNIYGMIGLLFALITYTILYLKVNLLLSN